MLFPCAKRSISKLIRFLHLKNSGVVSWEYLSAPKVILKHKYVIDWYSSKQSTYNVHTSNLWNIKRKSKECYRSWNVSYLEYKGNSTLFFRTTQKLRICYIQDMSSSIEQFKISILKSQQDQRLVETECKKYENLILYLWTPSIRLHLNSVNGASFSWPGFVRNVKCVGFNLL